MKDDAAREAAFARAYRTIRERIERATGGRRRLLVGAFTDATGLSPTPVREALSRLVGEGLIEECRGGGYFVPRPNARDIVEFYTFAHMLALGAVRHASQNGAHRTRHLATAQTSLAPTIETGIAYWLERIAIGSGNRLLALETQRLNARMTAIRRAEIAVMPHHRTWLAAIAELVEAHDADGQVAWIERYCDEGRERADELADWLST